MAKKVADVLVEVLQGAGVKHCYGIVGDTLNKFAESLSRSEIRFVHMRHEEAGALAAQGEAVLMERLTAVAGSCGPGSLHFINGLYEANRNRAPVILIASTVVRNEQGFEFIQEVDFKQVYAGCSVYCEMILTPEQARRKAVMACQSAIAKSGVAVLIMPVDIADSDAVEEPAFSVHARRPVTRPADADLDEMARILQEGTNVAIYAGNGCRHAHDEIVKLAERLKAPVAHTSRGKDAIEYDNPHNVGMTGIGGSESGYHCLLRCDTLLCLGVDFAWRQFYPEHAQIVQVDIEPSHLGRRHPVTLGVRGDIKDTLQALLPRIEQKHDSTFRDTYVRHYAHALEKWAAKASPGHHDKIPGTYLTRIIDRIADDDALFTSDDGTPTVWLHRLVRMNGKRKIFASLLHGTMAGAVATALGLQKCQPGRQVIALAGDGGFTMMLGDVLTTIQEGLPIKIAVYDNAKLGFVEIEQKTEGLLPVYTDLKNPDFGKVAEAMGLWGRTISKASELEEGVKAWLAQPGPALLNVKVQPMELVVPPFTEFKPAYGMAMYSVKAILHGKTGDLFEMVSENFL
jgi:pyruvate dehydrogenase (quinone)